jgi:arginase
MNFLTAPTSLGNRPYEDDGGARWTDRGPQRIRDQNIVQRLGARDLGDVPAAPYRDFLRPAGGIRNEDLVLAHIRDVARVLEAQHDFTLVVGGDCSVLLGSLLGLSHRTRDLGLVFIDGHADFNTSETSVTGAVAGMDLALATGRGDTELARLAGAGPLVRDENVVTVGVRDEAFLDEGFRDATFRSASHASDVLAHLGERPFFIHLDVDALDPSIMPFVDAPVPGGLDAEALVALLRPLVRHPNALGMEMTIYDPRHDADGRGAALLADILERTFALR